MTKAEALAQMADRFGGRTAQFERLLHEILAAGFAGANPYFALFDADERPWPVAPREMTAIDAITFVDHFYGREFAQYCCNRPEFITH
jgi:hypothetical protein